MNLLHFHVHVYATRHCVYMYMFVRIICNVYKGAGNKVYTHFMMYVRRKWPDLQCNWIAAGSHTHTYDYPGNPTWKLVTHYGGVSSCLAKARPTSAATASSDSDSPTVTNNYYDQLYIPVYSGQGSFRYRQWRQWGGGYWCIIMCSYVPSPYTNASIKNAFLMFTYYMYSS